MVFCDVAAVVVHHRCRLHCPDPVSIRQRYHHHSVFHCHHLVFDVSNQPYWLICVVWCRCFGLCSIALLFYSRTALGVLLLLLLLLFLLIRDFILNSIVRLFLVNLHEGLAYTPRNTIFHQFHKQYFRIFISQVIRYRRRISLIFLHSQD